MVVDFGESEVLIRHVADLGESLFDVHGALPELLGRSGAEVHS